jgi:hypothetical protein
VKGVNAPDLMGQPDIDGALVGGASLDADEYARIIADRLVGSLDDSRTESASAYIGLPAATD